MERTQHTQTRRPWEAVSIDHVVRGLARCLTGVSPLTWAGGRSTDGTDSHRSSIADRRARWRPRCATPSPGLRPTSPTRGEVGNCAASRRSFRSDFSRAGPDPTGQGWLSGLFLAVASAAGFASPAGPAASAASSAGFAESALATLDCGFLLLALVVVRRRDEVARRLPP